MNIAVLGASAKPDKYSNRAVKACLKAGHEVFPVNPNYKEIDGLKCFSSLKDVPEKIEVVSVYLLPEVVMSLLDIIIGKHPKKVYLNPGTEDDRIESRLRGAGIKVVKACTIVAAQTGQLQ